jgi:PPM family protein phosphatase
VHDVHRRRHPVLPLLFVVELLVGKRVGIGQCALEDVPATRDKSRPEVLEGVVAAPAVDDIGSAPQIPRVGLVHKGRVAVLELEDLVVREVAELCVEIGWTRHPFNDRAEVIHLHTGRLPLPARPTRGTGSIATEHCVVFRGGLWLAFGTVWAMGALALESVIRSDIGRRSNNEDAAFASARLAAVADGVGGEVAGEVASRSIINALIKLDKCWLEGHLADAMRDAVNWGNQTLELVTECEPDLSGMSTTLTAVALDDDGLYVVANVGDSRTYLFRDDELSLLTHDDSLVQVLVDRGDLTDAEAREHPYRSVVLEALDGRPRSELPLTALKAYAGDRLLLCSDGLSDVVDDRAIASTLRTPSKRSCADRLIDLALTAGGSDNISVVVADVVARDTVAQGWERP